MHYANACASSTEYSCVLQCPERCLAPRKFTGPSPRRPAFAAVNPGLLWLPASGGLASAFTSSNARRFSPKIAHQQRVAVRGRFHHAGHADCAAGADDIFDHDLLPQSTGHVIGQDARNDVGGAARRKRDHNGDLTLGIGALSGRGNSQQGGETEQHGFHKILPAKANAFVLQGLQPSRIGWKCYV